MAASSERVPIRRPPAGPSMAVAGLYLVLLLVVVIFAAMWIKVLVVYVALLFLSVLLVRGSVQLDERGLRVNSITRYHVKYDEMRTVDVVPTAVPAEGYSSLKIGLREPKRVLLTYVLPIPIRLSEVRADVRTDDAQALRRALADRLNLR